MAVTVDATNLVLIDAADSTTGWTSSMGGLSTTTLFTREGGTSLEDQASQETFDVYHTITSEDYSNRTIFGWMRSGGPDTEANDGFGIYLSDGTDSIAYTTGGSDNFGFFFGGWSMFRLNTADRPTNFITIAGSEASLTITAITRVGYAGNFPAKAAGNSNNVAWDVLRYCANANPALLVEGGTTGDRGTFAEIVTEDESSSNAWGIIRVLVPGSKTYELNFGVQIGSLDADSYFDDADFQLIINGAIPDAGAGISAGSMDVDCVGWASGTNVVNFDNFFVQSIGAVSNWTMSADLDTANWTNGTFVDCGTFTFPAADVGNKKVENVIFTNCGQVTFDGTVADNCTFNGSSNALGAVLWDENSVEENQDNMNFISDGTGHAVEVIPVGAGPFTFNIDGWTSSGYEATNDGSTGNTFFICDNASDADITINLTNTTGDFAYERKAGYTGTVSVVNNVTLEVFGVTKGARVSMHDTTGGTERLNALALTSDGAGAFKATNTYNHGALGDRSVEVRARSSGKAVAAIADDNGTLTDETEESNSNVTNTMTLLPASPVANQDRYYIGHTEQFSRIKLDVTDAATGATITWQYWNGAWVALSGVTDGTSNYSTLGESTISWTLPGDWATTTVNGQGAYYYVRAVLTAGTPDQARARKVQLDVTRYLPFVQTNTITSSGLSAKAVWIEDTVATF
jgi:hypothetical protein